MWQQLLNEITAGNEKSLARCISLVENEVEGYFHFLQSITFIQAPQLLVLQARQVQAKAHWLMPLLRHW